MLFIVSATYYNYKAGDFGHYRAETAVVGQENAYELRRKFFNADNVLAVDVIDAHTGEVIETWEK